MFLRAASCDPSSSIVSSKAAQEYVAYSEHLQFAVILELNRFQDERLERYCIFEVYFLCNQRYRAVGLGGNHGKSFGSSMMHGSEFVRVLN